MRYTITYGRKVNPKQYETLNIEVSQEFNDEEVSREVAFNEVRNFVLGKIEEELAGIIGREVPAPAPPESADAGEPLFYKLAGLESLPWTSYQTKQPCREGEAGWIFANAPGASELVEMMRREDGSTHVVIDGVKFLCRFSGRDNQFVSRNLWKK